MAAPRNYNVSFNTNLLCFHIMTKFLLSYKALAYSSNAQHYRNCAKHRLHFTTMNGYHMQCFCVAVVYCGSVRRLGSIVYAGFLLCLLSLVSVLRSKSLLCTNLKKKHTKRVVFSECIVCQCHSVLGCLYHVWRYHLFYCESLSLPSDGNREDTLDIHQAQAQRVGFRVDDI